MPGYHICHLSHSEVSILSPILEMKKFTKIVNNLPNFRANKWKSWNFYVSLSDSRVPVLFPVPKTGKI